MVSRLELCPNCGRSANDALYIPVGADNRIFACRHCDTAWGSIGNWATLEEYAHRISPDDTQPES